MTVADTLIKHVDVLARQIGSRAPASENEKRAADYVIDQLKAFGIEDVREQRFNTPRSAGTLFIPILAVASASSVIGRLGRVGRVIGGAGMIWAALEARRTLLLDTPSFVPLAVGGESRNVIARIAPSGEVKRFVFIVAHLDSAKQRTTVPVPVVPFVTKPYLSWALIATALTGIGLILSGLFGRPSTRKTRTTKRAKNNGNPGGVVWGLLGSMIYDETRPISDGANDNASGVAAALGLAQSLHENPLEHTEVVLLFTGAATAGAIGMTSYLDQYAPPKDFSTWINLEMVGATGSTLSYVAKGGLSYFSEYHPAPTITALTNALAEKHPEYGVYGKDVLILDETAALRRRGYEAITLAGVDRGGNLPRWHRGSDTPDSISPEHIERAVKFTRVIVDALDDQAKG